MPTVAEPAARASLTAARVDAVVVGAGVAGLAAALELQAAGCEVVVADPSDRPGGMVRTDHVAGFVVERGANTLQIKPPIRAFLEARALLEALRSAAPESRLRCIWRDGRLLAVPGSVAGFVSSPLLSLSGKLRMLAEPFVRRGQPQQESVAEFVGRRLGAEAVDSLVGPFLTGVYAGDETELGAAAVFPGLVEHELRSGSITGGMLRGALDRSAARGLPGTFSGSAGLGPFVRGLADLLDEPPALGTRVVALSRDGDAWRVAVESAGGSTELCAPRVVLATPAQEAGRLLAAVNPRASEILDSIPYAPVVSVALGAERAALRASIEGFGFLVPRGEDLPILGCLYMSRQFPGRAPEGRELLQCMLGGARWPAAPQATDDELFEHALRGLDRVIGLDAEPKRLAVARWPRAIPQPGRDHPARIRELSACVGAVNGLALAGGYVAGVGVADSFASGLLAARQLLDA
ncbi:MAG: protoporphyrinogen oxidase [Myxococcota bacterium]